MADNWSSLITAILIVVNLTSTTVTSNKSHISKDLQLPVVLSTLSPGIDQCSHIQWFCFNSTTRGYDCNHIYGGLIMCTDSGPSLQTGFCATYSEYTGLLSVTDCPYFELKSFNITYTGYIQLPSTLTKLNNSMCTPLNRRGIVCNDCVNGFGPSVNSFGYKCVNCNSVWYGVLLYLVLEVVPMTILYLVILILQVRLTSAPMTSFIMYAQFIVIAIDLARYDSSFKKLLFNTDNGELRLDAKIVHTLYGVFNLDFLHYAIPPFCISEALKPIHIALLGYMSVFYPLTLIFLTWICVELHGWNFRPFVIVWKPFHRCFVCLRRQWDKKNDIIDVFTTFLYLLYGKCLYQTLVLLNWNDIVDFNSSGMAFLSYRPYLDLSIGYGKKHHLFFMIPALIIFTVFNMLPLLLLIVYPVKPFRLCLSKCCVNIAAITMFTDKVYSCYKNGLDGTCDTRIFAAFYFILRLIVIAVWTIAQRFLKGNHWFCVGIIFTISSLIIALIRPYNKVYMNYTDCLLLFNLSTICYILSQTVLGHAMLLLARTIIITPIVILSLMLILKKCRSCITLLKFHNCFCLFSIQAYKINTSVEENQHLIHPTHSVVGYS